MQKFSELIKKSTEDGVGKKKPAVQNLMMIRCWRLDGRMYPSPQMGN